MGHAKANCRAWQESEAQGKQLRRGDHADSYPCSALGLPSPSSVCLHRACRFSCNQNPVIEEVERDLKLQRPCKNSLMLKHGICQTEFAFSVALGAFGRVCGRITPCSQDQREWMLPRSSAGMDGFPQAEMMCESLGKGVVGFYHRIVQNLFSSPVH